MQNKSIIKNTFELGSYIRNCRKEQNLTLEQVSGLSNFGIRFLSELERGKETTELGKTLSVLESLGLELVVQPRHLGEVEVVSGKKR